MLLSHAAITLRQRINTLIRNEIIKRSTLNEEKLTGLQKIKKEALERFHFYSIKDNNEFCLVTEDEIQSSLFNRNRNIMRYRTWTKTGSKAKEVCNEYREQLATISNIHQTLINLLQSESTSEEDINKELEHVALSTEGLSEDLRPIFESYMSTANQCKHYIASLVKIDNKLNQPISSHLSSQEEKQGMIEQLHQDIALFAEIETKDTTFLKTPLCSRFSNIKERLTERIKLIQTQGAIQSESSQSENKNENIEEFFGILGLEKMTGHKFAEKIKAGIEEYRKWRKSDNIKYGLAPFGRMKYTFYHGIRGARRSSCLLKKYDETEKKADFVRDFFSPGKFSGTCVSGGYREHSLKTFVLTEITSELKKHLSKSDREDLFKSIGSLYLHYSNHTKLNGLELLRHKEVLEMHTGKYGYVEEYECQKRARTYSTSTVAPGNSCMGG